MSHAILKSNSTAYHVARKPFPIGSSVFLNFFFLFTPIYYTYIPWVYDAYTHTHIHTHTHTIFADASKLPKTLVGGLEQWGFDLPDDVENPLKITRETGTYGYIDYGRHGRVYIYTRRTLKYTKPLYIYIDCKKCIWIILWVIIGIECCARLIYSEFKTGRSIYVYSVIHILVSFSPESL